jgi:hypothetical protein
MAADAETSSPLPPTDPLAFEIGDDGGLDGSRLSLPSAAADGQPSFCVGTESGSCPAYNRRLVDMLR